MRDYRLDLDGVQGVAGSNPAVPIKNSPVIYSQKSRRQGVVLNFPRMIPRLDAPRVGVGTAVTRTSHVRPPGSAYCPCDDGGTIPLILI